MGKSGAVNNSEFEQKFRRHRSSIQSKPKPKMSPDHPMIQTWVNPIEWIFQIILDYTIREGGIALQNLVDNTIWDTKTVRNHLNHLQDQERIQRVKMLYVAAIDDKKAGQLKEAARLMRFDNWGKFDIRPNVINEVDSKLLSLANEIGAFVIYTIIESINPQNPYLEHGRFGEKLSRHWFEYVLCEDVEGLLQKFKQIMLPIIHSSKEQKNNMGDNSSPNYTIVFHDILALRRSLNNIYPELMTYFDSKRNSIPNKLGDYKDMTEDATLSEKCYSNQQKCKHKHKTNIKDNDSRYYMRECNNCHKRWKIKKIKK